MPYRYKTISGRVVEVRVGPHPEDSTLYVITPVWRMNDAEFADENGIATVVPLPAVGAEVQRLLATPLIRVDQEYYVEDKDAEA